MNFRAKVSDKEHGQFGWIHLRQSIHNPNIAVNMQSSVPGGCQTMTRVLIDKYVTITTQQKYDASIKLNI